MTDRARKLVPNTAGQKDAPPPVLLPYQQRWVADASPFKIMEKGRRTGVTWAEASDDVLIAASDKTAGGQNIYYVGTDKEMTEEYIDACSMWARAFNYAAGAIEEGIWDEADKDENIKTFTIRFPKSGHKIIALASRPRKLRGRQGVLVGDEAAFQDQLGELVKAAMAFLIWGGKVRLISTHDGAENAFAELLNEVRAGKRKGTVHKVPFRLAVEEGLYRRVCLRLHKTWTAEDEAAWVQDIYDFYGDGAEEELDCVPRNSAGKYLTVALIESRMSPEVPVLRLKCPRGFEVLSDYTREQEVGQWLREKVKPLMEDISDRLISYYGMDFGRSGDLSVIWPLLQDQGLVKRTPFVIELRNVPFKQQKQVLFYVVDRLPRFTCGAHDARGNGQQLAEETMQHYGLERIRQVMLTAKSYQEMTPHFKASLEDGTFTDLPRDEDIKADLRAFEVIKGVARVPDSHSTGKDGGKRHGDAGIAAMLADFASTGEVYQEYAYHSARSGDLRDRRGALGADDDDFNDGRDIRLTGGFNARKGIW